MSKDEFNELLRAQLYAAEYGLLNDPVGIAVRHCLAHNVTDDFITKELMDRVHRHKVSAAFSRNPFRLPQLKSGDVLLGFDASGNPLRTFLQYFNAHFLFVGSSGSGKTTYLLFHLLQIIQTGKRLGIWCFDLRKKEFLALRPYFSQLGIDLKIIPGRKLRLNPLQVPKGVSPQDYAPRIAEILVQVLRLQPRSTKQLHTTILKLYRDAGVLSGSKKYPTLFDLFSTVKSDKESNPQSRQLILDSLEPVLLSLGVDVLGYHVGWDTSDIAKEPIIFDLADLAEVDKDLILNTLILSEFTSRLSRGVSNQKMDLYIVCDEAARIASASSGSFGVADQIGLIRGTGIGLSLSLQTSDVASAILSNTGIKIIGRAGNAKDLDTIGGAMGLTADERRWMALNLEPGKFICQLSEEWRYPFILRIPNLNLRRTINAPLETEYLGNLASLPVVQADFATPELVESSPAVDSLDSSIEISKHLSDAELRYLKVVIAKPNLASSQYSRLAKMGNDRAKKIREQLVNKGYLREHQVSKKNVGRTSIILQPSNLAYQLTWQEVDNSSRMN